MNVTKVKKTGLLALGSVLFLSALQAKNREQDQYVGIASLYCFSPGKIEQITGKKRSTLSPKFVKAWKLGNLGFTYSRYCGLATLNPLSLSDVQIGDLGQLSESIRDTLEVEKVKVRRVHGALASEKVAAAEFSELATRMRFSPRCERKFIGNRGFGPLGRLVKETLSKNAAGDLLNRETSFGGACPGYHEMNLEQRKNLWVFVMMAMSHYESSCQDAVTNQGPYGEAVGLLQLHGESENLYVFWDPDQNCDKGASRNPGQSLKCGLTMIGNQLYKGAPFFDDGSHWQVLRNASKPGSQAFQIRYALSQIPDCRANSLYIDVSLQQMQQSKFEVQNKKSRHLPELAMLR